MSKLLTSDERMEFMAWERLFESDGWRLLTEDMHEEVEVGPGYWFANASDWEQLVAARVRLRVISELLAYPDIIRTRKENLLISREQQALDQAESNSTEHL